MDFGGPPAIEEVATHIQIFPRRSPQLGSSPKEMMTLQAGRRLDPEKNVRQFRDMGT